MELTIKTREKIYDDDFAVLYYKGRRICRAEVEYFDECTFLDLRLPIPDGYEDDDWYDFFYDKLLDNFDEEQQAYVFEDYKLIILDV